jgi:hypothetical protein
VWYARKSEDAGTSSHRHEPTHDDEAIEADEEDHATEPSTGTKDPPPSATAVTHASVEQLSSPAVDSKNEDGTASELPAGAAQPKAGEGVVTEKSGASGSKSKGG